MKPLAAAAVVPPLLALGIYTDSSLQLPVAIDDPIDIAEWVVPWENSRPRDPYVGPDGRVWFVGQRSHYVAFLEPSTGRFEQFPLDPGTGPHNLIVDAEGFVWYAGNRAAHIGRLDPRDGSIIKFPMPDESARDPHTLVFDSNGDIWFTVQGGNFVGKLTGTSRTVRLIPVPTAQSRPYGIVVDVQDRPWVVEFGSYKIATIDPEAMTLREIELPRRDARPRRLAITSDGGGVVRRLCGRVPGAIRSGDGGAPGVGDPWRCERAAVRNGRRRPGSPLVRRDRPATQPVYRVRSAHRRGRVFQRDRNRKWRGHGASHGL